MRLWWASRGRRWVGFGGWVLGAGYPVKLGCGERMRQAVGSGSAGPCLRSQEGSGKDGFSRFARGCGLFAFNARSGTVPLPLGEAVRWLYWLRLGAGEPLV